jgi:hypothetical protein
MICSTGVAAHEFIFLHVPETDFTADAALLTAGVNAGERVVTLGVQKLEAGEKVRTIDEQ